MGAKIPPRCTYPATGFFILAPRALKTMKKLTAVLLVTASSLLAACGPSDNAPRPPPMPRRRPARSSSAGRQLPAHGFPRREQPDRRLRHRHGQGSQQAPGHGSRVQAHRLERQGSRAERQARRRAVERPDHHRRAQEEHQLHRALRPTTRSSWSARPRPSSSRPTAGKVVGAQDGSSATDAIAKDPVAGSIKEVKKFGDNVTALMDWPPAAWTPSSWTKWWVAT